MEYSKPMILAENVFVGNRTVYYPMKDDSTESFGSKIRAFARKVSNALERFFKTA